MSLLVSARTYQILWISCPSSEVMATFGILGLEGRPDAPPDTGVARIVSGVSWTNSWESVAERGTGFTDRVGCLRHEVPGAVSVRPGDSQRPGRHSGRASPMSDRVHRHLRVWKGHGDVGFITGRMRFLNRPASRWIRRPRTS